MDTPHSITSVLPPDPLLEQLITPLTLAHHGWVEIEELRVGDFRSYSRTRPGERAHYCITYKHRCITLTLHAPRGPRP